MILIKEFLRKKSVKIYISIVSVLLLAVIMLISFDNYYLKLINNHCINHTVFFVISRDDYYKQLKSDNRINKIEKVTLLTPDYNSTDIFNNDQYEITTQTIIDGTKVDTIKSINKALSWDDFIYDFLDDKIVIYPNYLRSDLDLKDNQIALSVSSGISANIENYSDYAQSIIGKNIGFSDDNGNEYSFTVSKIYTSLRKEMVVSDKLFSQIINISNTYAYNLVLYNADDYNSIQEDLESTATDQNIQIVSSGIEDGNSGYQKIMQYEDLTISLKYITHIIIIVLFVILMIVLINVINGELKSTNINRLLGFNKHQIKKYLLFKLLALDTLSLFISTIISIMTILILNTFYNFSIIAFNINLIFKIYGCIVFLTIVFSLFANSMIHKYVKKCNL